MRLEAAYVAISRVQVSRVQATKCPESMDPESKHSHHTSRIHLFRYAVLVTALITVFNWSNQLYHTEYIFHSSNSREKQSVKLIKKLLEDKNFICIQFIYIIYIRVSLKLGWNIFLESVTEPVYNKAVC